MESENHGGPVLLRTLSRYRWMTLLIIVVTTLVAYTLATQFAGEPTATARMVLADPRGNTVLSQGVTSEATFIRYLEQRADLARSVPVLDRARQYLDSGGSDLEVEELRARVRTTSEQSGDIVVSATGHDPEEAAAIANAVTVAYRDEMLVEHAGQRDSTLSAIEEARRRITNRGEASGTASPEGQATAEALARLEIRVADVLVDTGVFGDGVLFAEPAVPAAASAALSPARSAAVGGLLGLVLALAIGWVRDEQVVAARTDGGSGTDTPPEEMPDPPQPPAPEPPDPPQPPEPPTDAGEEDDSRRKYVLVAETQEEAEEATPSKVVASPMRRLWTSVRDQAELGGS